jgi:uncharacterized protein (DUF1330 family)
MTENNDRPKSVYVVNAYDIKDPETFKEYPLHVGPLLARHGANLLAMETNPRALEGSPKTMNAIIEFPSEDAVNRFYNDPDYQSIIDLRHKSTSNTTMIVLHRFEGN